MLKCTILNYYQFNSIWEDIKMWLDYINFTWSQHRHHQWQWSWDRWHDLKLIHLSFSILLPSLSVLFSLTSSNTCDLAFILSDLFLFHTILWLVFSVKICRRFLCCCFCFWQTMCDKCCHLLSVGMKWTRTHGYGFYSDLLKVQIT